MTALLRRGTSALMGWLGIDSASIRGFALGRPGSEWRIWSLRTALAPVAVRPAAITPSRLMAAGRVCR